MKLKTVTIEGVTYAALQDDKPVYVHDDGKEVPFDAPSTVAKIGQLNGEAKAHREAKEAAETKLKAFEGIEDAEAARTAIETVNNLKDGELITAGKAEEIKVAARKAAEEQVAAANKANADALAAARAENETLQGALFEEKIGGGFARSKFIADKIAVPADIVQSRFGQSFKIEEGKIVGYDGQGNKLYSRANPGEIAGFEEALELLVESYPYKDAILKGSGGSGTGKHPSEGGGGGDKTITRSEFEKIPAPDRGAKIRDGFKVIDG